MELINPSYQIKFYIDIQQKEKDFKTELDNTIPYIISLRNKIDSL